MDYFTFVRILQRQWGSHKGFPHSKVHGTNMGPIWGSMLVPLTLLSGTCYSAIPSCVSRQYNSFEELADEMPDVTILILRCAPVSYVLLSSERDFLHGWYNNFTLKWPRTTDLQMSCIVFIQLVEVLRYDTVLWKLLITGNLRNINNLDE